MRQHHKHLWHTRFKNEGVCYDIKQEDVCLRCHTVGKLRRDGYAFSWFFTKISGETTRDEPNCIEKKFRLNASEIVWQHVDDNDYGGLFNKRLGCCCIENGFCCEHDCEPGYNHKNLAKKKNVSFFISAKK